MSRALAQQAIEESIIEEAEERERLGKPRTLAQSSLDETARELKRRKIEKDDPTPPSQRTG